MIGLVLSRQPPYFLVLPPFRLLLWREENNLLLGRMPFHGKHSVFCSYFYPLNDCFFTTPKMCELVFSLISPGRQVPLTQSLSIWLFRVFETHGDLWSVLRVVCGGLWRIVEGPRGLWRMMALLSLARD